MNCTPCKTPTACSRFGCSQSKVDATVRAASAAVVAHPHSGQLRKMSHDECFANGCVEAVKGNPCVGVCHKQAEENARGQTAAQEVLPEGGEQGKAPGPTAEAPVAETASEQAVKMAALKDYVEGRLCSKCHYFTKPIGLPQTFGLCRHPWLPINLITGVRIFPAVTARQHAELCGYAGARWLQKR